MYNRIVFSFLDRGIFMNRGFQFLKKSTLFFVVVIFFVGWSSHLSAQSSKIRITRIATIDLLKLIDIIKSDSTIKKALSVSDKKTLSVIKNLQNEIKNLKEALEDEEEGSSKYIELNEEIAFKQTQLDSYFSNTSVLLSDQRALNDSAIRSLYNIIKQEAQRQGYALVIDRTSSVIYVEDDLDLTEVVSQKLKEFSGK